MNHKKIHDQIINRAQTRVLPKETYTEIHHVLPKSMGGSDDKNNLVSLTAKEHFIIHKLLVEIYPESDSMRRAIWCMSNTTNSEGRNYRVGAAEYERFRILVAEVNSKMMSGEGNPMFGRNPYQIWLEELGKEEADRLHEEKRIKRSITMKEKGIAPEHMAKIIEANKNKVYTDEDRQKMSERTSGENNPMFGRTGELNPRYGISTYDSWVENHGVEIADLLMDEYKQKMSEKMSGEGNPMFNKSVYDVWLEKDGKEEADRKHAIWTEKKRIKSLGNKGGSRQVKCTKTNVIYKNVKTAAESIGMKPGTLYNKLAGYSKTNETTFVFLEDNTKKRSKKTP